SVQIPSASRISEPVKIGVPTSSPNWVSLRPSSCLMRMPMIAKIVHTAKQTVKAIVDIHSAVRCSAGVTSGRASMQRLRLFVTDQARVDPPNGTDLRHSRNKASPHRRRALYEFNRREFAEVDDGARQTSREHRFTLCFVAAVRRGSAGVRRQCRRKAPSLELN